MLADAPSVMYACMGTGSAVVGRTRHRGPEDRMKSLKWAAALGAVAVGVIFYLNKDDVARYQKMRQM